LHADDLTYSFVGAALSAPPELRGFLSDGINESYKQICAGLIEAFRLLGLQTDLGATGSPYRHLQDCFLATTGCDLHHEGTKLIGSAQVRRRGVVMQHGSAPLQQEPGLMSELLNEPKNTETKRHINIFEVLGRVVPWSEFEQVFTEGFEKAFGVAIERGDLTPAEVARAEQLRLQYAEEFRCEATAAGLS
jgi:lipoate-protein ligase A